MSLTFRFAKKQIIPWKVALREVVWVAHAFLLFLDHLDYWLQA